MAIGFWMNNKNCYGCKGNVQSLAHFHSSIA